MYSAAHESFLGHGNQWSVEATFDNANPKMYFFSKYVVDGEEWDGVSYRFKLSSARPAYGTTCGLPVVM